MRSIMANNGSKRAVSLENGRLALRSLRDNPLRSALTTLGIVIGVAAVIAVVSIVQGLQYSIQNRLEDVGAAFLAVVPFADPNDPDAFGRDVRLTLRDAEALKPQTSDIEFVAPILPRLVRAVRNDRQQLVRLLGTSQDYPETTNHFVDSGRFISAADVLEQRRVVVVGIETARQLDVAASLGKTLLIEQVPYTVIGILEAKGRALGHNRDEMLCIPVTTAILQFGEQAAHLMTIDIRVSHATKVARVKKQIDRVLRQMHRIVPGERADFRVVTEQEIAAATSSILTTVTRVAAAVAGSALAVGGVGIMNIMLLAVRERTREIGLRKAVGARRSDVLVQFLAEALTLSVLGAALGVLLGFIAAAAISSAIPNLPAAHLPVWAIAMAALFSSAVGIGFGLYPAARAAGVSPIEALRHE
jgi:putative ABC transport system permease protein